MHTASLLALLPLALAAPSPDIHVQTKREVPAPLIKPRGASLIADKYIVKMKGGLQASTVNSVLSTFAGKADHVYKLAHLSGFSSVLSAEEVNSLRDDPAVDYIEQDAIVSIKATQQNAPWGLARLSSSSPGGTTYHYDESAGEGTCSYVVDTGVDISHRDFEGRASWGGNFIDNDDTDGQGHGTHCAGTIGSATYGVAKKTQIIAVKVLDSQGFGSNSAVIAGMDFVVTDAPTKRCPNGVVVNMSLGGETSRAVNEAAAAIVDAGLFLAVAAGNEAADAASSSPASEESACTVGATTIGDSLAEYSNFGPLVDVLAPGSDVESTWIGGRTETISGTSMAAPHVAGLAAYLLALGAGPTDPVELCSYIASTAVSGAISRIPRSTVNLLANNGFDGRNSTFPGAALGRKRGKVSSALFF